MSRKTIREDKRIYVKDTIYNRVYVTKEISIYNDLTSDYMDVDLELVCGWDYINPDENDIQGWCKAENFVEDVRYDSCLCYFMEESVRECLESNGYEILEKNPMEE